MKGKLLGSQVKSLISIVNATNVTNEEEIERGQIPYVDLAFIGFETKKDIINSEIYEVKFDYDHQSGCINLIVIEHVLNTEE